MHIQVSNAVERAYRTSCGTYSGTRRALGQTEETSTRFCNRSPPPPPPPFQFRFLFYWYGCCRGGAARA